MENMGLKQEDHSASDICGPHIFGKSESFEPPGTTSAGSEATA